MKNLSKILFSIVTFVILGGNEYKALGADSLFIALSDTIDIIVAADGSGNYTSLQAAINSVPNYNAKRKIIYIRNGYYYEKIDIPESKTNITLIGENVDSTILVYDDYSGKMVGDVEIGTSTSFSFAVFANDFTAMNLTISNSAGNVGQAVALRTDGDRQSFMHCRLVGYQDTYYTKGHKRNYLKDCYIVGATDYIFGRTTVVFDSCQIHSVLGGSYITAASTEPGVAFGYVFLKCRLTAQSGNTGIYLGRPWRADARTVFYECEEGSFINAAGWSIWSGNTNHETCFYAEYKCFGPGSDTTRRASWTHQLTEAEAAEYSIENIFSKATNPSQFSGDWIPNVDNDYFYKQVKLRTVKFMDSANYNAQLSEIKYNDVPLDDFSPEVYNYYIELPEGTTEVPILEATTENPKAGYTVKYPSELPGMSTIEVTAPDIATSLSYNVLFSIDSAFNNGLLESLKYSYTAVPDFQPNVFNYSVELAFGTTRLPTIQAIPQVDGSTVEITRPEEVSGEGVVVVTSFDGLTQNTYTIDFSIAPTGIEGNNSYTNFHITNPFAHTLDLRLTKLPLQDIELFIYNLQGELMINRKFAATTSYSMDASWLQRGVYIYHLKVDGKMISGKIIKVN